MFDVNLYRLFNDKSPSIENAKESSEQSALTQVMHILDDFEHTLQATYASMKEVAAQLVNSNESMLHASFSLFQPVTSTLYNGRGLSIRM